MRFILKKINVLKIALLLVFSLVISATVFEAEADEGEKLVKRIGGSDRYKTCVLLSKESFDEADEVVLVSGEKFPDALSAMLYAEKKGAPVLLSPSKSLNPEIKKEIDRLGASSITLIGGKNALSANVEKAIKDKSYERIAGDSRYDTALKLASLTVDPNTDQVVIASGENYPDALAAGPYSLKNSAPILLYSGKNGGDIIKFMDDNDISKALIVGGESAVDKNMAKSLEKASKSFTRVGGKTRYETALKLAKLTNPESKKVIMVSGEGFADALASASLANKLSAPIILSGRKSGDANLKALSKSFDFEKIYIIGGKKAINTTKIEKENRLVKPAVDPEIKPEVKPETKPENGENNSGHRPNTSTNKIRIFLDPGHGGSDSGAVANDILEKDVSLTVALKLRDELEKRGYAVKMSRETDEYVRLIDRPIMSNEWGADIFVSLHHNSANLSGEGLETWYYAYSEKFKPKVNLDLHNDPKRIRFSKALAKCIQKQIARQSNMKDRGIKGASYLVLRECKVPAVMVELGFVTSPWDSKWIKNPIHQGILANAVADGIDDYFK